MPPASPVDRVVPATSNRQTLLLIRSVITAKPRFPIRTMLLMGWWPSFLKVAWYRWRGHRVGRGVGFGFGSVLCAEDVEIGDGFQLGPFSFIRSRRLRIGRRVQVGAMCLLDTPNLEIGDDTKLNEQVYVGGLQFPDSRLTIGRNCQIMQLTFINPARHINIGDDTGIGGDCLLFGHSSWLSQLEGYPVVFEPIEIGRSVSLAWRVFVSAGAKIGDGAVVGANSLVNRVIPPRCLATGSPARVVARAPYFPRELTGPERVGLFEDILSHMVAYFEGSGLSCERHDSWIRVAWAERGWWSRRRRDGVVCFSTGSGGVLADGSPPPAGSVYLSLTHLPEPQRRELSLRQVLWLDLEGKRRSELSHALGEEVAQFLRRYGIRFNRDPAPSE